MTLYPHALRFQSTGMRDGRRRFVLTAPFEAVTSIGRIVAHRGFETDGASIPRAAWAIIGSPFDDYLEAAVIHDFLYSPWNHEYDRSEADHIFRELMWNTGVNRAKLTTMWAMVRLFGRSSFKANLNTTKP